MPSGIQDYLESLPEAVLSRLFRSPASVLAILRLLPPLAKQLVMQMAFNVQAPLLLFRIDKQIKPGNNKLKSEALAALQSLHIIRQKYSHGSIQINPTFAKSLRSALTSSPANQSEPKRVQNVPDLTKDFIASYSKQKWESILLFMVGSTSHLPLTDRPPSSTILLLLQKSELMLGPTPNRIHITSKGFQFLLQNSASQVWNLLLNYLDVPGRDAVETLDFIFALAALEIGVAYTLQSTGSSQEHKNILNDLAELGILYLQQDTFFPVVSLASAQLTPAIPAGAGAGAQDEAEQKGDGYIIIETNFRLYAYTDSPLQISILNLFCRLASRFSNLVVGRLTRESVRRAFSNGITADQLIQFLTQNAHPEMKAKGGLPPTISDQIKLWQLELDRFRYCNGYFICDFTGARDYQAAVSYATDLGTVVWKSDRRRSFFIQTEGSKQVFDYIHRQSKQESKT